MGKREETHLARILSSPINRLSDWELRERDEIMNSRRMKEERERREKELRFLAPPDMRRKRKKKVVDAQPQPS